LVTESSSSKNALQLMPSNIKIRYCNENMSETCTKAYTLLYYLFVHVDVLSVDSRVYMCHEIHVSSC
jgi:hypothetical protein